MHQTIIKVLRGQRLTASIPEGLLVTVQTHSLNQVCLSRELTKLDAGPLGPGLAAMQSSG